MFICLIINPRIYPLYTIKPSQTPANLFYVSSRLSPISSLITVFSTYKFSSLKSYLQFSLLVFHFLRLITFPYSFSLVSISLVNLMFRLIRLTVNIVKFGELVQLTLINKAVLLFTYVRYFCEIKLTEFS